MNFSGGKDSTYLVLELIRRDMPFDMVLNVDTGMEFPAMYEHIDKVERFLLSERGIPITRIKAPHTFEHLMLDAVRETKPGMPIGYGWPSIKVRWCTGQLKTQVIDRYLRHLPARPYHYIAFAADEGYRLERPNNQDAYKRYPMMDWGVTEAQALAGCYAAGYTWDGLYEKVSRASCWCCPLQSLDDLRALWAYYPETWAKLRDLDDRAIAQFGKESPYGQFRKKESVRMLELRFSFELDWKAKGGSTRSRAFYRELYQLYQKHFYPNGQYFTGPHPPPSKAEELLAYTTAEDVAALYCPEAVWERSKTKRQKHREKHREKAVTR